MKASLTLDPEVMCEKKKPRQNLQFFFKATSLNFDDSMMIVALKGSAFTVVYKDLWI